MTRAVDLLKNRFGVSQLYKHDIKQDDEIILTVYWHPLTIAERETIQKKTGGIEDANEFALALMIHVDLCVILLVTQQSVVIVFNFVVFTGWNG